jgi:hypothetical protein
MIISCSADDGPKPKKNDSSRWKGKNISSKMETSLSLNSMFNLGPLKQPSRRKNRMIFQQKSLDIEGQILNTLSIVILTFTY